MHRFKYTLKHHFKAIADQPLLAVFFFLPLWQKPIPLLIVLALIQGFRQVNFSAVRLKKINACTVCLVLLFCLYLVSIVYSDNKTRSIQDLETKLSLLCIPLALYTNRNQFDFSKALIYLLSGLTLMMTYCEARSVCLYLLELYQISQGTAAPSPIGYNLFFTSYFCPFIHHSYLSLYNLAGILFLLDAIRRKHILPTYLIYLLLFALSLFQLQLLSRAGIIFYAGSVFFFLVIYFRAFKKQILFFTTLLLLLLGITQLSPIGLKIRNQFLEIPGFSDHHSISNSTVSSVDVRTLIWERSVELISQHFWFGTGNGDCRDALLVSYQKHGMIGALEKQLNCHNQFLETQLSIGLPGSLMLFALFFFGVYRTILRRQWVLVLLVFSVAGNYLFESMLEVQAGSIFSSLLFSLLPLKLDEED